MWSQYYGMEGDLGHPWSWFRGSPVSGHRQASSEEERDQEIKSTSCQDTRGYWGTRLLARRWATKTLWRLFARSKCTRRAETNSISNSMNISSTLIPRPLSKLEINRPYEILACYLSCSITAVRHLPSRRDADALLLCMPELTAHAVQLIPEPHKACIILLFARADCSCLRARCASSCSSSSPLDAAHGEPTPLRWGARAAKVHDAGRGVAVPPALRTPTRHHHFWIHPTTFWNP
jgi:hypothetical protein